MPIQDRREDTLLKLSHFRRHKRKALKRTSGKTSNYPFHKPEENHPPGKDTTKKISKIIGKAATYAGSAKMKKVILVDDIYMVDLLNFCVRLYAYAVTCLRCELMARLVLPA